MILAVYQVRITFSVLHKLHHASIDLKIDLGLLEVLSLISGSFEKGAVEITNCFTVPHNESEDEVGSCFVKISIKATKR